MIKHNVWFSVRDKGASVLLDLIKNLGTFDRGMIEILGVTRRRIKKCTLLVIYFVLNIDSKRKRLYIKIKRIKVLVPYLKVIGTPKYYHKSFKVEWFSNQKRRCQIISI